MPIELVGCLYWSWSALHTCEYTLLLQIPYRTVEVSPLTKKQIKWADYKKVPVVMLDGEPYGDSTAIITRLAAELRAEEQSPDSTKQKRPSRGIWSFGSSASSKSSPEDAVGFCNTLPCLRVLCC